MFGKIKDKLKGVFSKTEELIEEEPQDIIPEPQEDLDIPEPVEDLKREAKKVSKKEKKELAEIEKVEEDMLEGVDNQEKEEIKEGKKITQTQEHKTELENKIKKEEEIEKQELKEIQEKKEKVIETSSEDLPPPPEFDDQDLPPPPLEEEPAKEVKKEGFFSKATSAFTKKTISEEEFERLWVEIEVFLLEINIAFEIVQKIEEKLRETIIGNSFSRFSLSEKVREVMTQEVEIVLKSRESDFLEKLKEIEKPAKILILGVNGTGKTTSIAKLVHFLQKNNLQVVVSASDTFRAAAVEQLDEHAKKVGFKLIKHSGGSDPAAVAFDAIEHAKAKNLDVVLVDTAGRMPNNPNLMLELQKIKRVAKTDMVVFIGDSIAGNDLLEQIELFDKGLGIDGVILTKIDTDERPGSVVTTAYSIEKPIFFLGIGQTYDDLIKFDAAEIAYKLFRADKDEQQ
ncbi:MAG: signal recognition particle-docking protein FtsY [Nanoarchaeota archaeon]